MLFQALLWKLVFQEWLILQQASLVEWFLGGPGVGVAAGVEATAGYFDNSIQSTTAPSGELNVNVPLTPSRCRGCSRCCCRTKEIGSPTQGPVDNALGKVIPVEGLPVDFQSAEVGAGVGAGGYIAATAGVAVTNKGVYVGGKDVTSQAKSLMNKIPTPFGEGLVSHVQMPKMSFP